MTYNLNTLDVSSLDFDDIKTSLTNFLEQQSDLKNLDFRNEASSVNLLLNILATATAYNGVYSQFGFTNSFATTATVLESLLGIAANCSVQLAPTKSAVSIRTVNSLNGVTLAEYSTFTSRTVNAGEAFFFNLEEVPANTSKTVKLYSGNDVVTYTNYNYETQSCEIPYTVDPETINFYVTIINTNVTTKWTRVSKTSTAETGNNKHFTVINGPRGYIVTNNSPSSQVIETSSKVAVRAVTSNGGIGNNSTILPASNTSFGTTEFPSGGYDLISIARARASILFKTTGQERCVTANDYKNAILSSGIEGTSDLSSITVSAGTYPGSVKIYVTGLSTSNQANLIDFLSTKTPVGITVEYGL